jgi:hypothetical protein
MLVSGYAKAGPRAGSIRHVIAGGAAANPDILVGARGSGATANGSHSTIRNAGTCLRDPVEGPWLQRHRPVPVRHLLEAQGALASIFTWREVTQRATS